MKVIIDCLGLQTEDVPSISRRICSLIVDELCYRKFREMAPQLLRYRMESFKTSSYRHRSASLNQAMRYAGINVEAIRALMTEREMLKVGSKLIDVAYHATEVFDVVNTSEVRWRRVIRKKKLVPTAATKKWLFKRNEFLEFLRPMRYPMVMMPLPWVSGIPGGYRFALAVNKQPLVRVKHHHGPKVDDFYSNADMPEVYDALNAVQATAWKINDKVYQLVDEIMDSHKPMAGIETIETIPLPPKPHDIETNETARREYRMRAKSVYEQNILRRSRVRGQLDAMAVAKRMRPFDKIWFPHNLDFRGRVYPIPDHLTPQGTDLQRALLQFANGKKLGYSGAFWLAVTGANLMGKIPDAASWKMSYTSYDDRVNWVFSNQKKILEVATDPWGTIDWWTQADEPLQFYGWCHEWAGFCKEGLDYVCGFPCGMDGSANGIQHYSALLQDPEQAEGVNMFNAAYPRDLYSDILEAVRERLHESASPDAEVWLKSGQLDRGLVKRPVMTLSYGATKWGYRDQIREELQKRETTHLLGDHPADQNRRIKFMADLIYRTLSERTGAAVRAMDWLKACVTRILRSKRGKDPIYWVAPTGFPVLQRYYHIERHRVVTTLAGSTYRPSIYTALDKAKGSKQRNSIAPNFVHSLDAAALMRTVIAAKSKGIKSFGMVHDSYSTVPADVEVLMVTLRDEFANLYLDKDILQDMYEQFQAQYTGTKHPLPEPPEKGDYDVANVKSATYFFS
jgi:DNA-directed RNA polymerase